MRLCVMLEWCPLLRQGRWLHLLLLLLLTCQTGVRWMVWWILLLLSQHRHTAARRHQTAGRFGRVAVLCSAASRRCGRLC